MGVRKWQGIAYIIVVGLLYGALFASPLDATIKAAAAVVLTGVVILDLLQAMATVYSHLDEREEKHQLVAERNASFTAIAILTVYILYIAITAAVSHSPPDLFLLAFPVMLLMAMAIAKGGTLLMLERVG